MKLCIRLIILGFTQFHYIFSVYINNTENHESYDSCPFTNVRQKRAQAEYTRWRANLEDTSEEFLVKIFDEDVTTSKTTAIVAVNILPATRRQDKIIVGGAIVPPQNIQENDILKDYTRFFPPTTGAVSQINDEMFLAPAPHIKIPSNVSQPQLKASYSKERHPQRDESPPASPQFLPRTPMLLARQYAPISPVVFTKFSSILAPTKTTLKPLRTSTRDLMFIPTRTTYETELKKIEFSDDEETQFPKYDVLTRSTIFSQKILHRSSVTNKPDEVSTLFEHDEKEDDTKINARKDSETLYNSMFDSDEDNNDVDKKSEKSSGDSFDDEVESGDGPLSESKFVQSTIKHVLSLDKMNDEIENETTLLDLRYIDDDELDNKTTTFHTTESLPSSTSEVLKTTKENEKDKRRPICNLLKLRQLNFNSPRTLPEIVVQLKQWAEGSPIAKWVDITGGNYTTMENPIYLIIVDDPSSGQIVSAKQTVMIVAGMQGRDHHAVAAAMYVLYQLIERSEAHVDLLTKYRFWIIPVFNPDGYDYSMTFPFRRGWIKNLKQSWDKCKGRESCYACDNFGLRCTIQSCYGVNLDRNFEYQWIPADELRSEHPCGDLYAGTRQLSEPETRALTHFLHDQKTPLYTFIAFKEGDVLGVMYPYSHTRKKRAFDHVYRQRASRAASAAFSISGRPYVAGQTSEFLPLYAGGIEDWVDGHLGIDNTYTIMMFRHTDAYNTKLITERVVHEAYAAMDTLLLQSTEPLAPRPVILTRSTNAASIHNVKPIIFLIFSVSLIDK